MGRGGWAKYILDARGSWSRCWSWRRRRGGPSRQGERASRLGLLPGDELERVCDGVGVDGACVESCHRVYPHVGPTHSTTGAP